MLLCKDLAAMPLPERRKALAELSLWFPRHGALYFGVSVPTYRTKFLVRDDHPKSTNPKGHRLSFYGPAMLAFCEKVEREFMAEVA